jgi:hypothetical protein
VSKTAIPLGNEEALKIDSVVEALKNQSKQKEHCDIYQASIVISSSA